MNTVHKTLITCAFLSLFGTLILFTWYNRVNINTAPVQVNDDGSIFYVQRYKLIGEHLELTGFYGNDTSTQSRETKLLHLNGIGNLLHQINPAVIQDDKLERAVLPYEHAFNISRESREVNCSKLFQGDKRETERAKDIMANTSSNETISPNDYIKITKNCSQFTQDRGYIVTPLTTEERNFPIAFSILMYKDTWQFERLLRAVYRPQNLYCIHVDGKSSDVIFETVYSIVRCLDNVFISSKRFKVQWGQMTVLEPELSCMQELWNKSKTWKYFINLTGQEFPLQTNYELVRILKAYNGTNDISGTHDRRSKYRWKKAGRPPHGITPIKGPVHIVASRGFVGYVLHDSRAKDLLNWTRFTFVPDETFFPTLNQNPVLNVPGSYRGRPKPDPKLKLYVARFKNWGKWPCAGKRVRSICIFGIGDLPLLAHRRELFANKFYYDYERFTLDCLEELHFNRTRDQYLGKLGFDVREYSKLGFI